jgi:hypothetical protein
MDASDGKTEHGDALAPDEERFVEVFVDYWIRRGSQLMRSAPTTAPSMKRADADRRGEDVMEEEASRPPRSACASTASFGRQSRSGSEAA